MIYFYLKGFQFGYINEDLMALNLIYVLDWNNEWVLSDPIDTFVIFGNDEPAMGWLSQHGNLNISCSICRYNNAVYNWAFKAEPAPGNRMAGHHYCYNCLEQAFLRSEQAFVISENAQQIEQNEDYNVPSSPTMQYDEESNAIIKMNFITTFNSNNGNSLY